MDKLKMMTADGVEGNIEKIEALFPCCVTERLNEKGKVEKAIDFEKLKQELSHVVVDGAEERYQFTWPDKKKSILLANAPINKTLRPVVCDEQVPTGADTSGQAYTSSGSVGKNGEAGGFDSENLYIEGDNLDVLKLLQETYMGKIKMIYIDPPYNTGNDFVYEDDFSMRNAEFSMLNEDVDEDGNRMVLNAESNGRFHTDWLNMIYPRLKLAKELLTNDGVIFISIDDNEVENLKKVCNEIFSSNNFIAEFPRVTKKGGKSTDTYAKNHDYVLVFAKSISTTRINGIAHIDDGFKNKDEFYDTRGAYKLNQTLDYNTLQYNSTMDFAIEIDGKVFVPGGDLEKQKQRHLGVHGKHDWVWRWSKALFDFGYKNGWIEISSTGRIYTKTYLNATISKNATGTYYIDFMKRTKPLSTLDFIENIYSNDNSNKEISAIMGTALFDYVKPTSLVKQIMMTCTKKDSIILDFFSGSATTAHAVMQLNAEDGGNRKFIMAQLPEITDEKSEAFKAGYKNICEIGKERIRRAGKKIADNAQCNNAQCAIKDTKQEDVIGEQNQPSSISHPTSSIKNSLDIGFRVLKLDTTNMKDVYYRAENYSQGLLDNLEGNIKADRKPQDLLLQVMLDMGVMLSSKIEIRKFAIENGQCVMLDKEDNQSHLPSSTHLPSSISHLPSYTVFIVGDYSSNIQPNLIACFDDNLSNELVTAIAKMKPLYAVFRDSSFANDSVATNFEQIFTTYSPTTTRKVL